MYEARQNKATAPHIISKRPTVPLKSINDYRRNNLLQLMKLKELPINKITLYIPLLWDQSKIKRFLQHYAEEEILDLKKIPELIDRFEESGVIQEGLKDLAKESKDFDEKNIPQYDGPEIPMIIHRFWSGGPMNKEVVTRLLSEKTENPNIKMILWHSEMLENKMKIGESDIRTRNEQREELKKAGFDIKKIEELVKSKSILSKIFAPKTDDLQIQFNDWDNLTFQAAEKKENIAYLSDIARLMYLYEYGGHHMDVDIGMGKMFKFRKHPYKHGSSKHPDIPLLGGLLRDKTTTFLEDNTPPVFKALEFVQNNFGSIFSKDNDSSRYFKLLLKQAEAGAATNSLIATHSKNKLLEQGLTRILNQSKENLGPGMGAANDYLNDRTNVDVIPYTIPEYLFELQHYTSESDNLFDS